MRSLKMYIHLRSISKHNGIPCVTNISLALYGFTISYKRRSTIVASFKFIYATRCEPYTCRTAVNVHVSAI